VADFVEFAKYFLYFVLAVVLILLLAYWPPKGRGIFGRRIDNDEHTLFERDRWWKS